MNTDVEIDLEVRNLSELTDAEMASLSQLKVSKRQEIKGGSFLESLEAGRDGPSSHVLGLCFLLQGQPVGMTLFKKPPLSPSWADAGSTTIHGLKITLQFQGKGFGHRAFKLAVQYLKGYWPDATTLKLVVDTDNAAALAVYRAYGMEDSGPIFDGPEGLANRFNLVL